MKTIEESSVRTYSRQAPLSVRYYTLIPTNSVIFLLLRTTKMETKHVEF